MSAPHFSKDTKSSQNDQQKKVFLYLRHHEAVVDEEMKDRVDGVVDRTLSRDVAARPEVEHAVGIEVAVVVELGAVLDQLPGLFDVFSLRKRKEISKTFFRDSENFNFRYRQSEARALVREESDVPA